MDVHSDFTVICPCCKKENDFTGDDWHDELLDDSGIHYIACLHCGKTMAIEVSAIYSLSASIPENEDD